MHKPDYGIDFPGLVRFFFIAGIVSLAAVIAVTMVDVTWVTVKNGLSLLAAAVSVYLLGMGVFMVYYSRKLKLHDRDLILDLHTWSGSEKVLDVGCGRGLLLIGAAKRLTTGTALGIDVWRAEDQGSNSPEATIENAVVEGVCARIEVKTADMRQIPSGDNSFDVIVSNWTVHSLDATRDRRTALTEMVRVLRPGGTLLIADIVNQDEYFKFLVEHGMKDVQRHSNAARDAVLNALTFGSFAPFVVSARKNSCSKRATSFFSHPARK